MGWAVLVVLVVLAVIASAVMVVARSRHRTADLQDRFGPEYERALDRHESRRDAEQELSEAADRRDALTTRDLTPAERSRFTERWMAVQAAFVDSPAQATVDADRLVGEVMRERGYPVDDFDARADMVAVDHPHVVESYRAAHAIAHRGAAGGAGTDDLREGFVHFRALFDELLGDSTVQRRLHPPAGPVTRGDQLDLTEEQGTVRRS